MIGLLLLVGFITLLACLFTWGYNKSKYWERKGVKCKPGLPFVGNCLPMLLDKSSVGDILEEIYHTYSNELVVGYYEFTTPRLLAIDHDLIQKILVKDFGHFVDHGFEIDEKKSPLDNQLFVMNGNKWRAFRTKLAPIFTSGKLKNMLDVMSEVGDNLLGYLNEVKGSDVDIREAMGLFSMDIIGSAAFGINPGVLKNPNSEFRTMGKKINDTGIKNLIRVWLFFCFPILQKKFGFSFLPASVRDYFCGIIKTALDYRKKNNIQRNDFIEMMIQLKERGNIELKSLDASDDFLKSELNYVSSEVFEITDDVLMAQALSFLMAGFEATALLLTYAMLEISKDPELQDALRKEATEQTKLHGGVTYEALRNMKLLEQTIKETQRVYPLVPCLNRVCTKSYTLPNGFTIDKGEYVNIPVTGVHMNPHFYPDPKSFKPERFTEQPKPGTFLPFGEGPRICIAMRYAMLVIKYGLALMLINYSSKLSPETKLPVKFINRAFGNFPSKKILFRIEKLEKE